MASWIDYEYQTQRLLYAHGANVPQPFAQAVDPYHSSDVFSLFARDVERTCRYFARFGVERDARELARKIWTCHMGPIPELV